MADIYIYPNGNQPSLLDSNKSPVQSIMLYKDAANSRLISDEYYATQKVEVSKSGSYLFKLQLKIDSPIGLKLHPYNSASKIYNPSDLNYQEIEDGDTIMQLVRFSTTLAEYTQVSEHLRVCRIRFGTAENNTGEFRSKGLPPGGYFKVNYSGQETSMFIQSTIVI